MSSLTLETDDVVLISKEDKHIILNCTYQNNFAEIISDNNIGWRIRGKNEFKDVAIFSRPGGYPPYVAPYMEDLNKNRIELIAQLLPSCLLY